MRNVRAAIARLQPARARGFTLLEILMVITVISILLTITITAGRGIQDRSRIARAKADMAVIATALEQYKQHYGDYPWTPYGVVAISGETLDGGAILFNALCGNMGPKATAPLASRGPTFIELAKLKPVINDTSHLPNPDPAVAPTLLYNWIADPWGKWYWYYYKKSATDTLWKSPSYLLYTHGPDMDCHLGEAEDTGYITDVPDEPKNVDNVYYGRD